MASTIYQGRVCHNTGICLGSLFSVLISYLVDVDLDPVSSLEFRENWDQAREFDGSGYPANLQRSNPATEANRVRRMYRGNKNLAHMYPYSYKQPAPMDVLCRRSLGRQVRRPYISTPPRDKITASLLPCRGTQESSRSSLSAAASRA